MAASIRRPGLTLLALTIAPRLVVLAASLRRSTPFGGEAHDGYLQIAQNIVAHGFIGLDLHHLLYRGPLLPLLLVPGVLMGHAELWSAFLHLAASVATCLLVYESALMLTGSVAGAFAAASLVTLDPWLIWFVKTPMTPVTATFFAALAVFFFAMLLAGRRPFLAAAGIGAACALGTLDHPALIAMAVGFALAILTARWSGLVHLRSKVPAEGSLASHAKLSWSASIACTAALGAVFFLTVLPYTIRNYRDSGRFILIGDSGGLVYLLGTTQYSLIDHPWSYPQWPAAFQSVADRLHVMNVADLGVEYWTIDDRFYPELNRQARLDFESALFHHPAQLARRTAVMAAWFFAGDYSVARTLAHLLFLPIVLACWIWAWRVRGFAATIPFLLLILPGVALHSLTMSLNGHAAYSIPYIVPLAMPLALALAGERAVVPETHPVQPVPQNSGEAYAFE